MTRAAKNLLVLDGSEVKLRLQAERVESKTAVHVDWVRFTVRRKFSPAPSIENLFPLRAHAESGLWDEVARGQRMAQILAELPNDEFAVSTQAFELGCEVGAALGPDFAVNNERKKGHDFYRFRWAIERNGTECGWIGFLASGDSPRQQSQSSTIHCNLFGAACTFAASGWRDRLADIVDARNGDLTRCDLALDFFDGLPGGIESILEDYKAGRCDVGGKRLKSNMVGRWPEGIERSLYFGSKEAGKQTNCYEKGHQLFGPESGSEWLRVELRYGNKLRELSTRMLRHPADFFAGASAWHASILAKADQLAIPEKVKCTGRLALETVEAECTRNLRWLVQTAAASVAVAVEYLGVDDLWQVIGNSRKPGRLQKFSASEIQKAFTGAFHRVSSVESSPAFA
ncbi:MAG: replication initiation factor domain-containing protein [Rhodoferax sp.]|uniref:replication initiation factor domain-containing protein n=1 Tax=Rhodoferax sp. TaxID=50421 RepID=UPI00261B3FD0|nr:replication initiation factor domain-containing protein [Rhodoferax sp.]MDD5333642.1 replication initiation factor domain-containing protein [Rhodoferax sp.]MDD5333652.1 replication initiation factor domain-containing protein [Rhodoferax sp.]